MDYSLQVGNRLIGPGRPVYIIAEASANHCQKLEYALALIKAAKECGADAVKFQAYTPDTLTIPCDRPEFRVEGGTPWDGRYLYELYAQAYTPWDWFPKLREVAVGLGLDFFATAFDPTAVDFLEEVGVPVHKVASFEVVDIPLIRKIARTGKPLIISTGMASLQEIGEAVEAARNEGAGGVALLKCTSAYPAPPEAMNLRTIPHLAETFGVPVGLSDHTSGIVVPTVAVALGACIVEKHFTLSRALPSADSAFSLEPSEFKALVEAIRTAEKALGGVKYGVGTCEAGSIAFRRSLFVVKDVRAGETFTEENVRSIRPGHGLPPKHLQEVLGRRARINIARGTPLRWEMVGDRPEGVNGDSGRSWP